MHYDITSIDDTTCITFEGVLNAMEMIFMTQSPEYTKAIMTNSKILLDYSNISGHTFTPEDAFGITMLGKRGVEKAGERHIAVAVNDDERSIIEKITKTVFSDSQSTVDVTTTKEQALEILARK